MIQRKKYVGGGSDYEDYSVVVVMNMCDSYLHTKCEISFQFKCIICFLSIFLILVIFNIFINA